MRLTPLVCIRRFNTSEVTLLKAVEYCSLDRVNTSYFDSSYESLGDSTTIHDTLINAKDNTILYHVANI